MVGEASPTSASTRRTPSGFAKQPAAVLRLAPKPVFIRVAKHRQVVDDGADAPQLDLGDLPVAAAS